MEPAGNNKSMTAKKPGKKKALKIAAGIVVFLLLLLILAVAVAVPAYVSSDSGKRFILAKANASGAGAVDFANLSMSWWRGISIDRLSFKDSAVSVAVKEFSTRPSYGALLTGNLSFGQTIIDEPRVEIDVEKIKQKSAAGKSAEGKQASRAGLPVKNIDLVVRDGDVKIKGANGAVEISQINSSVDLRSPGEQTKFEIGANIAGGGRESTINAKGGITPGRGWALKGTSGDLSIEVNNLDLNSLESILAIAGVEASARGVVSANLKAVVKNGVIENISGAVSAKAIEITAPQLQTDRIKSSVLDAAVEVHQQGDLINVEKLSVQTDWLKAEANGVVPINAGSVREFMKADSKYELKANLECNIPAVAAQLPKTLGIKEQTMVTAGKLVGSVATLSEGGQKKLAGQVSIDGLAGMVEGKPIALSEPIQAQVKIASEGEQVKFEKVGVTSAFANVNCEGTFEAFSYDAQIDMARLAGELGQFADLGKYKLAGQVASRGQISNNVKTKTTTIAGSASIVNLKISPTPDITINEPNASVEVTAEIDNAAQVLLVKQLKADTSLGQLAVKDGKLPMGKDTKAPVSLTASARGVDLAKLQPYLVMTKAISKDLVLGGVAESDVTFSSKNGSFRVTTESTKIANLLVKSPGKAPFMQNPVVLVLDAEVNPAAQSWQVHKLEITSPDIKVKGTFEQTVDGNTSNVQGNAQLDYDWKTLSNMLSAFMPSALNIEGKRKDTISFSSRYPTAKTDAMLANLNAQAKVGFDKAAYMGLNIGATNVDIKVDKGLLVITPFTTTVNNGRFNFGGSADFKKTPALFRTSKPMAIVKDVQLNDEMMNKLLGKVNPVFTGATNASGVANFDCSQMVIPVTGGRPEDVDIAGTVSLTQVQMQPTGLLGAILTVTGASGGQMMIHPTPFTVKDGFVRYQNMQMDIGTVSVNFAGSVPLDPNRKIENFSVVLPMTATGKTVKIGKGHDAERITAYVKGTPRHPQLDVGKMVQQQAIQTGLDLLMEKTKKK
ncbi:MAG: hypothetical protein ABSG82_08930 [Sedimentisphaerales bacterium]|jgi:hypothetical protein